MMSRPFPLRALIYAAAILIVAGSVFISTQQARAAGGTTASCYLTWFGWLMGPAECGSPPPGSECSPGCTGPMGGLCPIEHCWTVFIPDPPSCVPTQGTACTSGSNSCGMTGSGSIQCDGSCSATTPSDSLCPPPPPPSPTCADFGMTGTYPSCSPSCTPDSSCQANTCTTTSCSDSCGNTYPGTKTTGSCAVCTPDSSCQANTCTGSSCSDSCGNSYAGTKTCVMPPPTCTSPTVSITASPTRVSSGGSATLAVTGTGISTSCSISNQTGSSLGTFSATSCNANASAIPTGPLTSQGVFTVTCDGGAATAQVIVNVNPTFKPF